MHKNNNLRKDHKRPSSLLFALLLSGSLLTIIGCFEKKSIYKEYTVNIQTEPALTVVMKGIRDAVYPWQIFLKNHKEKNDIASVLSCGDSETDEPELQGLDLKGSELQESDLKQSELQESDLKQSELAMPEQKESEDTSKATQTENEETYEPIISIAKVEKSYFDDALFIGDSRTEGLSEYSYLDNATYYADVGMSIYSIFDRKICKVGKKMVTIDSALKKKEFRKIYIMLGINELGTGDAKTFQKKYDEVIKKIEELQPNAYIVIQGIMNVGKEKSKHDRYFNNENIAKRNAKIKKLADNKKIFYLDINEAVTDASGYLPKDMTFDDVHLKGKYYDLWADYLLEHGIVEE